MHSHTGLRRKGKDFDWTGLGSADINTHLGRHYEITGHVGIGILKFHHGGWKGLVGCHILNVVIFRVDEKHMITWV